MKKVIFALIAMIALTSCGNKQNANFKTAVNGTQKALVEVLYFHGKQRCVTCNAIENLTKEVIEKDFAQAFKDGKIVFRVIDISTKEGEKIADKYEVTWSSLFINKWQDGKESKNNMTDFGFSYAKSSPEVFKVGMKKKIESLLK
ncbi:MAG: nitrophenyl compound nitroreductase subunit ArsF family protein [Bacteroidales bacterium]